MQEASKLNIVGFTGDFSVPRLGRDLRPVLSAVLYLVAYMLISWGMQAAGVSAVFGAFSLTAGLNMGMLMLYGMRSLPVVAAVIFVDGLWLHPVPYPTALSALYCAIVLLVQFAAVLILNQLSGRPRFTLKSGRDLACFTVTGLAASIVPAAANSFLHIIGNGFEWRLFFLESRIYCIGFAAGIFCLTPVLVIHAGPKLETLLADIRAERPGVCGHVRLLGISRHEAKYATGYLCLIGAALYFILAKDLSDFHVFLLLSIPLICVAIRNGLEGLAIAIPGTLLITLAALTYLGNLSDSVGLIAIIVACSLNACLIAAGVTETRAINRQMESREAILDAVSYATQRFLGNTGWASGVREILSRLGEASMVTRVFLIDNRAPHLGGQVGDTDIYEWAHPHLSPEDEDKRVLNLLRSEIIKEQSNRFASEEPYVYRTGDMPRKQREMLQALGIRSGVIIPMFVERQWWGCLGLEQCFVDREWPESEIDGLKMAGQILGTMIASVRVEQQFRQLTGNINAVFWISTSDGRIKQYVSPGYEEVWGRSCASLQKDPKSWLEAIHPEDRPRVHEALVKQGWGEYDEEFRVERPDGSTRWVRDRAFPVRDQSGIVYRIVGIAEDITKQKEAEEQIHAVTVMLSSLINHLHSGVMVEDENRRITHVNRSFISTFNVPLSSESLSGVDSRLLFIQTASFAERIERIIKDGTPILGEELEWQGKIFLRNYVPLVINENNRYHLWQYQDITESRKAEAQIKASLKEKEVLLKEIHHRVKNNLQIISSLLNLQSGEIEDPKASQKFRESQDRVKAMALIHERLYQSSDLAKIDFAGYVRSLTGHLMRSYKVNSHAIRLILEIESVPMNLDVAIPCGLMINELVSNAFKYAFPQRKEGDIHVRFSGEPGRILTLLVSDNGIGFPPGRNPEESDSLGLKLVRTLTEQLGGTIRYESRNGFHCAINIPQART